MNALKLLCSCSAIAIVLAISSASALAFDPYAPGTATSTRAGDPWFDMHRALDALARGDRAAAQAWLAQVIARVPDHPAAEIARSMFAATNNARSPSEVISLERPLGEILRDEKTTGVARAELVTGQTFNGLAIGAELCVLAECEDARAFAGLMMLGAGGGLGLSLALSSGSVRPGEAAAVNAGAEWGAWNALALTASLSRDPEVKTMFGALIVGQLAGVTAGGLVYRELRPSAGDVSLSNTVGLWSGVLTAMLLLAAEDVSSRTTIGVSLIASDLGLAGGMLLASRVPMSRGRALLIDLGGGVGTLVGIGVDLLAQSDRIETRDVLISGVGGALVGLALSAYLTRNFDLSELPVQIAIAPAQGGGGQLMLGGTW